MKHWRKYLAEAIGTMLLVVFGCSVAVATGCTGNAGIIATAFAFGLALLAMYYAIGKVSGCHLNPAVTFAMLITGKASVIQTLWYFLSQIVGAVAGSALVGLFFGSFADLGGNVVQPMLVDAFGGASLLVAPAVETVMTFAYVFAVLGVTRRSENKAVSGVVIGMTFTLVYLLGIHLTGGSANPARSLAPALLQMIGGDFTAISQIWIFIVGPFLGAALAAVVNNIIDPREEGLEIR